MRTLTHLSLGASAILCLLLLMSPPQLVADAFVYQTVNLPQGYGVSGITNNGTIYGDVFVNSSTVHGFLLNGNNINSQSLGYLTFINGINNLGQVVGLFFPPPSVEPLGYLTTISNFASYTPIQVPGAIDDYPTGINDKGQVVGVSKSMASGTFGYLLSGGIYSPISVPASTSTDPNGINKSGQIVGFYIDSANVEHGFVESGGVFSTVDVPGAFATDVTGINNLGEIVGYYTVGPPSSQQTFGFLLENNSFTILAVPGLIDITPAAINDMGQIVGGGFTVDGQTLNFEAILTTTPEPSTWSLWALAGC